MRPPRSSSPATTSAPAPKPAAGPSVAASAAACPSPACCAAASGGRRAPAFLACPPAPFGRLAGPLRAAAPDAHWDFVCFYPPPENPGAGVRVLQPAGPVRFALALVLRALLSPYRSVWIAVEDVRR